MVDWAQFLFQLLLPFNFLLSFSTGKLCCDRQCILWELLFESFHWDGLCDSCIGKLFIHGLLSDQILLREDF